MKNLFSFFLVVSLLCGASCTKGTDDAPKKPTVEGGFRLHSALQDGMVIQQNQPFRVWGRSPEGVEVTASASWTTQKYSAIAPQSGRWVIEIPVPAAPRGNAPQTITISTTVQTQTLSDLLIGEVWLLGGQSNMSFNLSGVLDGAAEVAAANYPEIRFFTVAQTNSATPDYDWHDEIPEPFNRWYKCTPEKAASQSGVGYFFGRMLYRQLDVPIGLVNTSVGGAAAQAYTPIKALEEEPWLKEWFVDPFEADPSMNVLTRPSQLFNGMVAPLMPLSIRGFLWYQGEGNWSQYTAYTLLMKTLISEWRRGFAQKTLPFYFVQIAPWAMGGNVADPNLYYTQNPSYFYIREAQAKTREQVAATGMVVTMDVGDPADIHPTNKKPVGERLARLALNQTYGRTEINCLGPRYKSHSVDLDVLKISFDHAQGLNTSDGQAPKHFYLAASAGTSHKFYPATAEINGDQIWLTCPEVLKIGMSIADVQIRYAYLMYPVTNLRNGDTLPAEPFRTDNWEWDHNNPADISYVY